MQTRFWRTGFYDASGNIDLRAVDYREIASHAHRLRSRYRSQMIKRAIRASLGTVANALAIGVRGLARFVSACEFRANKPRYSGAITVRSRSDRSR